MITFWVSDPGFDPPLYVLSSLQLLSFKKLKVESQKQSDTVDEVSLGKEGPAKGASMALVGRGDWFWSKFCLHRGGNRTFFGATSPIEGTVGSLGYWWFLFPFKPDQNWSICPQARSWSPLCLHKRVGILYFTVESGGTLGRLQKHLLKHRVQPLIY